MTIGRHLIYRLGLAVAQAAIVVVAMIDRYAGIGVLIGIGVAAFISAFRDHRLQQQRAAEAAELDQRLAAALALGRQAAQWRADSAEEQRWS
jgi:putative Mn2+ efflux pump MntP